MVGKIEFEKLNKNWNADPNAPELQVSVVGKNIILEFYLDTFISKQFNDEDRAKLVFYDCLQYRVGSPNDEGFYKYGQSRYAKYGVKWGEFYLVHNSDWQTVFPDVILLNNESPTKNHYLFYFRDEAVECIASDYSIEFPTQKR